ncbi:MAG: DNA-3-methyladenine glycosylase [Candidatus Koribacter versatilis]|uniref:Putative 3-methyladenine DNA glycosylase n=1 Tax=Candidatus Korobacter versatilis TaxID=658062 RepID=A0A932EP38_9BACT|nr:DNA-3-methyladenine glycosylase [Candidatus Koribacter versatilis]
MPKVPSPRPKRPPARRFYARDPRRVARELLGKLVVRREGKKLRAGRVVEVEAYLGAGDLAAHAAAGKTARNAVLFGPPGHAYVYFIYGNHYCLNVSCEPEGEAGCVLVRALEPVEGIRAMAKARGLPAATCADIESRPKLLRHLTSGPGRLCAALSITRARDNGTDVTDAASGLFIAGDGFRVRPRDIVATPRVGITKAENEKLRYVIADSMFVSGTGKSLNHEGHEGTRTGKRKNLRETS